MEDLELYFCKDSLEDTVKHVNAVVAIVEFYQDNKIDIVDEQ